MRNFQIVNQKIFYSFLDVLCKIAEGFYFGFGFAIGALLVMAKFTDFLG